MDGPLPALFKPHRFTATAYYAMAEAGVFDETPRVELIDGQVIDMAPIGTPHRNAVNRLTRTMVRLVGDRAVVSVQNSVRLDDFSEPQPDIALLRPETEADDVSPAFPADVFLLVEVADSSLGFDRRIKASLYAASGIVEYWIVNLADRVIEVHRRPERDRYAEEATVSAGRLEISALPGLFVSFEDILPTPA